MANEKYVFFLDIDGTLLNDNVVCRENRRAIKYAREHGHFVFINTARSMSIIPEKIKRMPLDGFVTSLGCSIFVNKEKIYSVTIPVDELAEVYDYFCRRKLYIQIEGTDVYITNHTSGIPFAVLIKSGKQLKKMFPDEELSKVYIPHVLTDEQCRPLENFTLYRHPGYTEFCVKGHNKATGIKTVMDYLGLDMKYSVAVGDSINDLEMLRAAGTAVVMGESSESVKKYADIITCPAREGGVAQGIYTVINSGKHGKPLDLTD